MMSFIKWTNYVSLLYLKTTKKNLFGFHTEKQPRRTTFSPSQKQNSTEYKRLDFLTPAATAC